MRHLAVLLAASLAACAVDPDLSSDGDPPQDDSGAADDPAVPYATALSISVTSEPAPVTSNTTATFAFTTSKPATTKCRIDGAAYAACSSPVSFAGLANGNHSFDLKATASGKTVAIPTYSWTVDTTAPVVSFGSVPSSMSNLRTPTFSFTVSGASAATCSLDFVAPTACTSPVSYGPLADGPHTLTVGATDAAGNYGWASYPWTIDATGPAISGLGYSCDPSGLLDVSWSVSDASGVGYGTCSYAGSTWDCTGVRSWTGYVSGASSPFTVAYYDYLNNRTTKSVTIRSLLCQ